MIAKKVIAILILKIRHFTCQHFLITVQCIKLWQYEGKEDQQTYPSKYPTNYDRLAQRARWIITEATIIANFFHFLIKIWRFEGEYTPIYTHNRPSVSIHLPNLPNIRSGKVGSLNFLYVFLICRNFWRQFIFYVGAIASFEVDK